MLKCSAKSKLGTNKDNLSNQLFPTFDNTLSFRKKKLVSDTVFHTVVINANMSIPHILKDFHISNLTQHVESPLNRPNTALLRCFCLFNVIRIWICRLFDFFFFLLMGQADRKKVG